MASNRSSAVRLPSRFARTWEEICELGAVLRACRFSVAIIIAGAALLLLVPQGWELAVRLPDEPWHAVAFHVFVFIWAFECWYWARVLLKVLFSENRQHDMHGDPLSAWQRMCVDHVPRLLAAVAYVVTLMALMNARVFIHALIVLVTGVIFYVFLVRRHKWRMNAHVEGMLDRFDRASHGLPRGLGWLRYLPRHARWVLAAGMATAVLCTVFVVLDPVTFGWALGAAAVPFIGFALIVPVGSLAVYASHVLVAHGRPHSGRSLPTVAILLIWALFVGLLADNHAVRTLPAVKPARATFDDAVDRWHIAAKEASGQERPPLIVVSAAGGGLRAAYWTATVLGALQDRDPDFGKYVFAISGVSGGSLGAGVFVTLLAEPSESLKAIEGCAPSDQVRPSIQCVAQKVLDQDFLAPTAAGFLFPDLLHNFIPVFGSGRDRAAALEKGWERAWGRAGFNKKIWEDRSFTELWSNTKNPLPALLLSGVHVATGKRIMTSSIQIELADAYDVFEDMVKTDLPISTAIHNSARFTYVSPAGTLLENGTGKSHGRIVDGGYFENFGAATARETLRAAKRKLRKAGVRPFIIQISNDPNVVAYRPGDDAKRQIEASVHERWWCRNEIASPICALLKTRDGRGTLAYKEFLEDATQDADYAHFRLCQDVPLGWVLAKSSTDAMRAALSDKECGNEQALKNVLDFLKARTTKPVPDPQAAVRVSGGGERAVSPAVPDTAYSGAASATASSSGRRSASKSRRADQLRHRGRGPPRASRPRRSARR